MLFNNVLKKLRLLPYALLILFSGYFAWYGYYGPRGYERLLSLRVEYQKTLQKSEEIKKEKEQLALKVKHMYSGQIDPDLLDEMARKILNFANTGDIVIFD